MIRYFSFWVLVFLTAGPAAAQTEELVSQPGSVLNGFTVESLKALGAELGYAASINTLDDEQTVVFTNVDGNSFNAFPTACDGGTCVALELETSFGKRDGYSIELINDYNVGRTFAKVIIVDDTMILSRYLIADFGMIKGNLAVNIVVFDSIANDFGNYLQSSKEGPSSSQLDPLPGSSAMGFSDAEMPKGASPGPHDGRRQKAVLSRVTSWSK